MSRCVCMFVCVNECMCAHSFRCTCMHVYTCMCRLCVGAIVRACVYPCVCVYYAPIMGGCNYVCMCVCVCVVWGYIQEYMGGWSSVHCQCYWLKRDAQMNLNL